MNFLIDAQLPPGLVRWLADPGHEATHVQSLRLDDAEDSEIWDRATVTEAIIITKDEDFADRTARSVSGPVIVWLRIGNSTNRALSEWLETRWPAIMDYSKTVIA